MRLFCLRRGNVFCLGYFHREHVGGVSAVGADLSTPVPTVVFSTHGPNVAPASVDASWLVITWLGSSELDVAGCTVAFAAVGIFCGLGKLPIIVVAVEVRALPVGPHAASTTVTASAVTPITLGKV